MLHHTDARVVPVKVSLILYKTKALLHLTTFIWCLLVIFGLYRLTNTLFQ